MAEELRQFADILEQAEDFDAALNKLIKDTFTAHQRIIFNGNGYEGAWMEEAESRGLANLRCAVDTLDHYYDPRHVALFEKHGVYTAQEFKARSEIHFENYCKVIKIEANTMVDMVKRDIYPAVCKFMAEVANTITAKRAAVADIDCTCEETLLRRLTGLSSELIGSCKELENTIAEVPTHDLKEEAHYYRDVVFAGMAKVRAAADELELITSSECWPYPSYGDILFSVR